MRSLDGPETIGRLRAADASPARNSPMATSDSSPVRLLYDVRVRAVLYQVVAVALVVGIGLYLFDTVSRKLAAQNIATGFDYLSRPAGFDISQSFISYDSGNSYGRAILVGLLNTIWVSVFAVIISTVLGLVVGIARLSRNPLLSTLALIYVEALRNVPLLLYLFSGTRSSSRSSRRCARPGRSCPTSSSAMAA